MESDRPITSETEADYNKLQNDEESLNILEGVYSVYGHKSAYDLMKQTHKEDSWLNTEQSHVISDRAIKEFFDGSFEEKESNYVDTITLQRLFDENKDVMDWLKDK